MVFQNYGGAYQLRIRTADDLAHVCDLDETHWAITSAPVEIFRGCSDEFLKALDEDSDGRILSHDLKNAQEWLYAMLANREHVTEHTDVLHLPDINAANADAQKLLAAARQILVNLGHPEVEEISLQQLEDTQRIMAQSGTNGDGVVCPESVPAPEVAEFVKDVITTIGAVPDAGGANGIGLPQLEQFEKEARAYLAWKSKESEPEKENPILPIGQDTYSAFDALQAVRPKVERYFALCKLVGQEEGASAYMGIRSEELAAMDMQNAEAVLGRLAELPLSKPAAGAALPLGSIDNPAHAAQWDSFRRKAALPALGQDAEELTEEGWGNLLSVFAEHEKWRNAKAGACVEPLGAEKLQAYLDGPHIAQVKELIENDLAVADEMKCLADLKKLVLYQKWLFVFANNFVNLSELYDPGECALFEMGYLQMEGNYYNFSISVKNRAEHSKVAANSNMFLMYLQITPPQGEAAYEVAVPVTGGKGAYLRVGRRGVFFDRDDRECDAVVTQVQDAPISLWQALKSPFARIGGFLASKAELITGSGEKQMQTQLDGLVTGVQKGVEQGVATAGTQPPAAPAAAPPAAPAAVPAPAQPGGMNSRDLLIGGSVAFAALGSAFAFITKTLSTLKWFQVVIALAVGLVVILVPTLLFAVAKLRRRNIGSILEASGMALNARMKLTPSLGRVFTEDMSLPRGAHKQRVDLLKAFARRIRSRTKRRSQSAGQ